MQKWSRWLLLWIAGCTFVLVAAACGKTEEATELARAAPTSSTRDQPSSIATATRTVEATSTQPVTPAATPRGVAQPVITPTATPTRTASPATAAVTTPTRTTSTAIVLQDSGPRVTAVVYPRPDYVGSPWSQWGQGVVLADGRVVSAIGDHLGRGGNSFIFVFDPETGVISRVGDVANALDHPADSWGFGKIHGQMVLANNGDVYFSTYWGTRRGLEFDDHYQGDVLFRMNTDSFVIEPVTTPVPRHGVPSLAGDGRFLYGEAVDPESAPDAGGLFVFDTAADEVVAWFPDGRHTQFRNVIVNELGAMVAADDGGLLLYTPDADAIVASGISLGDQLRASTRPDSSGAVYTVTNKTHDFAAIESDGTTLPLGSALDYTTSIALLADESGLLYVPGARGNTSDFGAPLIEVDLSTGAQTTLVELDQMVLEGLGLVLGGSYNLTVDRFRGVAHIGFNAGPDKESPWGEVVLISVELDHAVQRQADRVIAGEAVLEPATADFGLIDPLTGIRGHAVAVADVNGDGWDDLFVGTFADRPADTYAVRGADGPNPDRLLLGGPGGYHLDQDFPGRLSRTAGAAFADLDGDLDPDLIVSRNVRKESYGTEVLRNENGTFVPAGVLDDSRGGRAVDTLDYDGDGDLDIFLVEDRWTGGSSVLFRNDGDLGFTDQTSAAGLPSDVFGLGLGVADLDGNGADDLVIGGSNRIFLGDGLGHFTESVGGDLTWEIFGPEDDVDHVAIGDVNGDDRPDIVLGHHYNSTLDFDQKVPVRLYLNDGIDHAGNLLLRDVTEAAGLVGLPTKAPKVLLVDLNGDNLLDIVTTASANNGDGPAVFYHQGVVDGLPQYVGPDGLGAAQYWIDAAVIDADRDGHYDLFLIEWEPSLSSLLFRNVPS